MQFLPVFYNSAIRKIGKREKNDTKTSEFLPLFQGFCGKARGVQRIIFKTSPVFELKKTGQPSGRPICFWIYPGDFPREKGKTAFPAGYCFESILQLFYRLFLPLMRKAHCAYFPKYSRISLILPDRFTLKGQAESQWPQPMHREAVTERFI